VSFMAFPPARMSNPHIIMLSNDALARAVVLHSHSATALTGGVCMQMVAGELERGS
jgi:hypothetical protein